ncbi:hypothetical protein BD413DRAFT_123601 [Trametes elegans]|nr:hypothetical protein BD413DRAFT_123601 [Trametes elegans]
MSEMSLQPIEHTPPGLLDEGEIASITNAGLTVPVTIDTSIVFLTPNERAIPILPCLKRRVRAGTYTWAVYMAEGDPDSLIGLKGDVWINATPYNRKIYVLGRRGTWGLWGWYNKGWPVTAPEYASDAKRVYKKAMRKKSLVTHASVPHPWLRGRRLEFDGVCLRWGVIDDRLQLHLQRLDEQLRATGWPKYAKILPDWIAEYLCTSAPPSRGRVVVPPSAVRPELDEEYKPIPGPGWHGCAVPHTAFFGKDARVPAPSLQPVVKLEEAEDENTVRRLLMCLRDMSSVPPATPQSPEQRVKYEDQVAVAGSSGHSMTALSNTPAVQGPSAYSPPHAPCH